MDELMRKKYAKQYYKDITEKYGGKETAEIWNYALECYSAMLRENVSLPAKIKHHTDDMIFPAVAVYKALLKYDAENALEIMERAEDSVSRKTGALYRKIFSPAIMRKPFFRIFSRGTKEGFSAASGFENTFIRESSDEVRFDITKCPYCDFCKKYGCPELALIFCDNDINAYGHLRGIVFERHETLGRGGAKCDFHLYAADKK